MEGMMELKPCPFCKCKIVSIKHEVHYTVVNYFAKCRTCGAQGPTFAKPQAQSAETFERYAIGAWNQRKD